MLYSTYLSMLALATAASALQITAPTNSSGWTSSGAQEITWDAVSTDPSNFTIRLVTPSGDVQGTEIADMVMTSDNSYSYTPDSDLTVGNGYRVNLVQVNSDGGEQILAQSDEFEVEQGTSTASSSSSASGSSTSQASQTSSSASASASSGAASSSSAPNGAGALAAPGGLLLMIAGAVGALA